MKKIPIETYHVRIYGRVQGVGFRLATLRQAHALHITGWVRNLDDGSVEVLVQGQADQVDEMLQWLHFGSVQAKVSSVEAKPLDIDRRYAYFDRR